MSAHPAIVVSDLVKRYKGADRNAVDGVSFSVEQGSLFALLGPNGAGKTTTISILTTTLAATSGSVQIAGADLAHDQSEVRRRVGIIFQKPSLDRALTGEENCRFHAALYGAYAYRPSFSLMPQEYRERIVALGALVGLDRDDLFKKIAKYSGGMRRKLEIARSLLHRPQVLFLDEPTVGLDLQPTLRRQCDFDQPLYGRCGRPLQTRDCHPPRHAHPRRSPERPRAPFCTEPHDYGAHKR